MVWSALAVMLLSRGSYNVVDPDIFHGMALFRESLMLGRIPKVDLFSYGPTLPYSVHHEWGSGALAWFIATWLGAPGILLLKYVLIALLASICVAAARKRIPDPFPALAVLSPLAILYVGDAFSPIRAHLYSLVCVAALLYCLELDRRGNRRWIAFWLFLYVLWVNLHGGFVLGILLAAAEAGERLVRRERWLHLAAVAAAMLALVIVNPYGFHYYPYLATALTMQRPGIAEWFSPFKPPFSFFSIAFLASFLPLLYTVRVRGLRAMPGLAILLILAIEGALHRRLVPFYSVGFSCYLPAYLDSTPFDRRIRRWFDRPALPLLAGWLIAGLFFLQLAISFQFWSLRVPGAGAADTLVYPTGAVDYLAHNRFRGNVMTPFEYGAFVSWKLYPAVRVSLDSRYEAAYPNFWVSEVMRCYNGAPEWQRTLTSLPTDLVLVRRTQPLASLIARTDWRKVYSDGAYEIYERSALSLPVVDYGGRTFPGTFP